MDDQYLYAIEYFDSESVCSQWQTIMESSVEQAVKYFKRLNPNAHVYEVFVKHADSDNYYEEF